MQPLNRLGRPVQGYLALANITALDLDTILLIRFWVEYRDLYFKLLPLVMEVHPFNISVLVRSTRDDSKVGYPINPTLPSLLVLFSQQDVFVVKERLIGNDGAI